MLRVGLTGGLGSGKSTAAAIFRSLGAHVLSSDEIGRTLMQSGEPVFAAIVAAFGPCVLLEGGHLNRPALSKLAFTENRLEELNAIVHPAVIERQSALAAAIGNSNPHAIVIVESALIFETKYGATKYGGDDAWRHRFDTLILITAPEELRISRFIARSTAGRSLSPEERTCLEDEARRRIAQQIPDEQKSALCDYILTNSGPVAELEWQVDRLWPLLSVAADGST